MEILRVVDGPSCAPLSQWKPTALVGRLHRQCGQFRVPRRSGRPRTGLHRHRHRRGGQPLRPGYGTITLDVTPPEILIDTIAGDDEIGLLELQGVLQVSGTTDAEVGQEVTLTFDGQTSPAPCSAAACPRGSRISGVWTSRKA